MTEVRTGSDWDPRAPEVLADQLTAYDAMRGRCPVAHSDYLGWTLFRHDDVVAAARDHDTFSNVVSPRVSVPNGMDPPEHTEHRRINERYFTPERMSALEPAVRDIAARLVADLPRGGPTEVMDPLARAFALRVQSAFMGWPAALEGPLRDWTLRNHRASLSRDPEALAAVALEFDGYIRGEIAARRRTAGLVSAPGDVTAELLTERVDGRPLTDEELVSLIRNWTVGELSTIAACVGILVHALAERPEVQQLLRTDPAAIPSAVDELLRIHPPLVANRRRATRDVEVAGRRIPAGAPVTLLWASANRDETVMGDPDEFRLDRDPADNLLYGTGIHACPGAPLARLELQVMVEALLAGTEHLGPVTDAVRAAYPASGYTALMVGVR
ncbi:cytochrome P450 [Actinotalea fermentans]|nr:cytochrome P450 [Actinotalea fermentans]KGM15975.1 cytochrome P450 [Actinotalea fermentans ATCC 43279 = JCM 9966 = DSM 3133]